MPEFAREECERGQRRSHPDANRLHRSRYGRLHPLRRGQQRRIARQARRTLGNLLVVPDAAEEGRSGQVGEAPAVSFAKVLDRAADLVGIGVLYGRIRPWIETPKVTPR